MAALGIKIPMIAGRGLGYTGGTIDKLECIPGFNTSPRIDQFNEWVEKSGYAIMSQSKEICPDRKNPVAQTLKEPAHVAKTGPLKSL